MANGPLVWDKDQERLYETGISKVVLYPKNNAGAYGDGVAWNGVTSVDENPSGAEATPLYANNKKYLNLRSAEEFGFTLGAYTYPDEFAECDGSKAALAGVYVHQQPRKEFGFCYRTEIGNDTEGVEFGYELHLVYNCSAAPSQKTHSSINDSPEATELSWEVTTTNVDFTIPGDGDTSVTASSSHISIKSTEVEASKLAALEAKLYGSAQAAAELPTPEELFELIG